MKTSPTAPLALLCLGLASLPAAASDPWDAPFNIVVGGFNASATTTARLDSDFGGSGTEVSFENASSATAAAPSAAPSTGARSCFP